MDSRLDSDNGLAETMTEPVAEDSINIDALSSCSSTEMVPMLSVQDYVHRATADNTRKAYRQDIRHFEQWGGKLPTDVQTIVRYFQEHATTLNPRTLKRRLVALRHFHVFQGFDDPTDHPLVKKTLRGIQNTHGVPKKQAQALRLNHLTQILDILNRKDSLVAARNAALLVLGFYGALRGSELIALKAENIAQDPKGLVLTIPRSKTDTIGEGQNCALPRLNNEFCPQRTLDRWMRVSGIEQGYLFRSINRWDQIADKPLSVRGLNLIIQSLAHEADLPNADGYSSHSLRRGLATSASAAGASFKSIMQQGRWRHEGTVLGYIEEGQQFNDNAVQSLFNSAD